ncbi:hypothetical protein SLS56_008002 [Neofusicoccum ribis]|uniref:JmjC domain-containing protein n=1 Tax=Neofusicoccum ribis TaxID=45134 RepID=A0ABR3SLE1_9PEZI
MLARPRLGSRKALQSCRRAYATRTKWPVVRAMEQVPGNASIQDSRMDEPCFLSHDQFRNIDAIYDWFKPIDSKANVHSLKTEKFRPYAEIILPLEYTGPDPADSSKTTFKRFDAPLGVFLDYLEQPPKHMSLYLAQCKIDDLPTPLRRQLSAPPFVRHHGLYKDREPKSGRRKWGRDAGLQIYDTSIWMGLPPTYTPLHRDPNPNCFFQMAGKKTIRLLPPEKGLEIFQRVKKSIGEGEGDLSGKIRGEEMMMGKEREALKEEVWGSSSYDPESGGLEAKLERGSGLYIPEGAFVHAKN